ncbi:MAG: hypothetical protein ABI622_10270, partial [Chloroflexota bacterium]
NRPAMQLIVDVIEWVANDSGTALATLFPYMLLGLAGLYVLWLVIGYLRVSQVAIRQDGAGTQAIVASPGPAGLIGGAPRGVPYCPVDGLQYPVGARYCVQDEAELLMVCTSCGAVVRAADEACYRCGTPTTTPASDGH